MGSVRNSYDYVVVGAGSAGSIVAARLAREGGARVLLLEAGPGDAHWTIRMPGGLRAHYEPLGAARDAMAVVDPAGRVLGVERLRVVDASIMPSIASSNLNAVVMMMAEKLSDAVLDKPPLPPVEI